MHIPGERLFWYLVTRLGEAEIILPTAIVLSIWLVLSSRQPSSAWRWLVPLGTAATVTTITKLAFLGWGIGIESLDFTGISGHAMFAAAIYPVMAHTLLARKAPPWPRLGVWGGYGLAALIAVSRVVTRAHSPAEAVAGFVIGGAASLCALALMSNHPPRFSSRWIWAAIAGWLVIMPLRAAPSSTHDVVTRIAITLADRDEPFSRADLHRSRRDRSTIPTRGERSDPPSRTIRDTYPTITSRHVPCFNCVSAD